MASSRYPIAAIQIKRDELILRLEGLGRSCSTLRNATRRSLKRCVPGSGGWRGRRGKTGVSSGLPEEGRIVYRRGVICPPFVLIGYFVSFSNP